MFASICSAREPYRQPSVASVSFKFLAIHQVKGFAQCAVINLDRLACAAFRSIGKLSRSVNVPVECFASQSRGEHLCVSAAVRIAR